MIRTTNIIIRTIKIQFRSKEKKAFACQGLIDSYKEFALTNMSLSGTALIIALATLCNIVSCKLCLLPFNMKSHSYIFIYICI